jgi:hypothetical protein
MSSNMINSATDTCLLEMGYHVMAVPPLRRNGALRDAIVRSGIARVMHRLRYQAIHKGDPFARDDLYYLIETHPLHLRDFGYSIKSDANTRSTVLRSAANVYGLDKVMERLTTIATCVSGRYLNVIAEDVKNMKVEYDLEEDEIPPILREVMRLCLRLRDYGYSMSLDREARQDALKSAISVWGADRVIGRLMEVSVWHKRNPVVREDIAFCSNA